MTIKTMKDNMVEKYGFEHKDVIKFFKACEDYEDWTRYEDTNLYLQSLYDMAMDYEEEADQTGCNEADTVAEYYDYMTYQKGMIDAYYDEM